MPDRWWQRRSPKDIQSLPWLSPLVIARLEEILQPVFEVIEHGSGGSTLWFAERVQHVTAYEINADWFKAVQSQIPANAVLKSIGLPKERHHFDLLLIDGEPIEDRRQWIKIAPRIVKAGGWIILDNANRPEYVAEREWLKGQAESCETIDSNEFGTLFLVTDFYKMKEAPDETRTQPEQGEVGGSQLYAGRASSGDAST